jgi:hypothetical protein
MEINPNLWKFKACNKDHNYNRVAQWKKTPTCESLDLVTKTTTMAIETTSKSCAMKKNLNLWKAQSLQQTLQQVGVMQWRKPQFMKA